MSRLDQQHLHLVQIVRRYGAVGGMERYVWEMSREMAELGHHVTILCEQILTAPVPDNIKVVTLGCVAPKPRWLAHLRFSARVSTWLAAHPDPDRIVHSHERSAVHQFTTFHGPPFASVKSKPWWKRISPRIYANLWLEQREVCGAQVKAVIPNSSLIADALRHYYPAIRNLASPVAPGVGHIPLRPRRTVPADGGVIGFIGKEWQRKGLDIAVNIVAALRQQRPQIKFIVAGPKPDDIRHLFNDWNGGYTLLGETDSTPLYARFDLLLHPARQEPYGMVIAEARAAAVPILISNSCGIASELCQSSIIPINAPIAHWLQGVETNINLQPEPVIRHWKAVANAQIACYQKYIPTRTPQAY